MANVKRRRVLGVSLDVRARHTVIMSEKDSVVDEEVPPALAAGRVVRFDPILTPGHTEEFFLLVSQLGERFEIAARKRALDLCQSISSEDRRYRAVLLLAADLVSQGWTLESHRSSLWATPASAAASDEETVEEVKSRLRATLQTARNRQLLTPSVRSFIRRMERPHFVKGAAVSVLNLVDDGTSLAAELRGASSLPPSERLRALRKIVDPTIELVLPGAVCPHTQLPLSDIWRYFRHTWSLEYRPTPGRGLLLIIRNGARPYSPVMGIAALANAVPQLTSRDRWIGWSVAEFQKDVEADPGQWPSRRDALMRTLEAARDQIRSDDLLKALGGSDGLAAETGLVALANAAESDRDRLMRHREDEQQRGETRKSLKRLPRNPDGTTDWLSASETPLFTQKRARTLAAILFAIRVLNNVKAEPDQLRQALSENPDLRKSIAIGLREIRKVGLASRLLELNVCGAVQPYRDLLGGKLAALSIASQEVSDWYYERYKNHVSEIASQMAGRPVVREPILCAVTTTSLYGVAASQYNRLRLTVQTRDNAKRIEWRDLGLTEGFGTGHLSEETVRALTGVSVRQRGARRINNVFGEGTSPRMRQVREAISDLGIDANSILRHNTPRRVYGLEVFPGGLSCLAANRLSKAALPSFSDISQAWIHRWLEPRIQNSRVLGTVATAGPDSVRADLAPRPENEIAVRPVLSKRSTPLTGTTRVPKTSDPELVRGLYRALSSCADHHEDSTIQLLHVPTAADEAVLTAASNRFVVFVTGNPGDGKTHLIRNLHSELSRKHVTVVLDANERTDADLIAIVESTLAEPDAACVIAINQGILVDLLTAASDKAWAADARRGLLMPFAYLSSGEETAETTHRDESRIRVIDLNLRNNLGPEVVARALALLVELAGECGVCSSGTCPGERNAKRLSDRRVQERLISLLDAIARAGFHATMRDLQGFLSFLIFGNSQCGISSSGPGVEKSPYWNNAFEGGVGELFDRLREYDPRDYPLPLLDDRLWRHADSNEDWCIGSAEKVPVLAGLHAREAWFVGQKRRALFEHRDGGGCITRLGSTVDQLFVSLVASRRDAPAKLIRLLNRFFDRDEERDDSLFIWASHRYDARPSRYAAAAITIPADQFEVAVPTLSAEMQHAFPHYRPAHFLFRKRGAEANEGMIIDRDLLEALVAAEEGLPSTFRRGEPEARIAAFYDRLASGVWERQASNVVRVRLVDIDTGKNIQVRVNVQEKRFEMA